MKQKKLSIFISGLLLASSMSHAQTCNNNIPRTAIDSRYEVVVGSNGSEVVDKKTQLIWQRCSLGQIWDGGTCTGTASTHIWTDALLKAKSLGNGYRLPNIQELQSLVERACYMPTINVNFFPNTPTSNFWSGSSSGYSPDNYSAWQVQFNYGYSSGWGNSKDYLYHVRAVRNM